jgi:hypothetical protein
MSDTNQPNTIPPAWGPIRLADGSTYQGNRNAPWTAVQLADGSAYKGNRNAPWTDVREAREK